MLAQRGGGPVLGADTVWTTRAGRCWVAPAEVDEEGRPGLGTARGDWVLVARSGDQSARLGPDLLGILRDGTLPAELLNRTRPPQVTEVTQVGDELA